MMELPLPPRLIPRTSYCIVCKDVSNLSLHAFPKRSIDREKWLRVLNVTEDSLKQKPKSKVCAAHFHPTCFSKSAMSVPRLMPGALPNKRPYMNNGDDEMTSFGETLSITSMETSEQDFESAMEVRSMSDIESNHVADPTLPMIDECSTFLSMPTAAEMENISNTIVSSVPIMDELSFSMHTPVEVEEICAITDMIIPDVEHSPTALFEVENDRNHDIGHFESIQKYETHNQGITNIVDNLSEKQLKRNFEVALKTIEKHKQTIKTLQQSNRRLRKRVVRLEELLNDSAK